MTLTLFCIPAHFNKHNVTFTKLGTNDVDMMTSWHYCFQCYSVFGNFSLTEIVIIKNHIFTRGYATREKIAFYDHT